MNNLGRSASVGWTDFMLSDDYTPDYLFELVYLLNDSSGLVGRNTGPLFFGSATNSFREVDVGEFDDPEYRWIVGEWSTDPIDSDIIILEFIPPKEERPVIARISRGYIEEAPILGAPHCMKLSLKPDASPHVDSPAENSRSSVSRDMRFDIGEAFALFCSNDGSISDIDRGCTAQQASAK